MKEVLLSFDWSVSLVRMNPVEWLTTLSYFLVAFLTWQAGKKWTSGETKICSRVVTFWKSVTIILVLLGISELFDIQLLITHVIRQMSKAAGWYHQRGEFQKQVILYLILASFIAFFSIVILFRKVLLEKILALVAIAFLCGYIAVRLVSYHDVDALLAHKFIGVQLYWLFELVSVSCIGFSAGFIAFKTNPSLPISQ